MPSCNYTRKLYDMHKDPVRHCSNALPDGRALIAASRRGRHNKLSRVLTSVCGDLTGVGQVRPCTGHIAAYACLARLAECRFSIFTDCISLSKRLNSQELGQANFWSMLRSLKHGSLRVQSRRTPKIGRHEIFGFRHPKHWFDAVENSRDLCIAFRQVALARR